MILSENDYEMFIVNYIDNKPNTLHFIMKSDFQCTTPVEATLVYDHIEYKILFEDEIQVHNGEKSLVGTILSMKRA